ncbi:cupin-like domain-containing protein [Pelomonas cellulosilytica]|uniref:Cupin-like domain-containing protein n=1 Tax=Pelomonas cellulosilytica TaxID=2906762 RepID=A0ABS8XRS9_9BURK|nr:cupin-like domain-containing protein [Pelomonas sp. P8]MCE4554435.1 cupin-like domain-containing protein [Pelomonas sp. P8]
MSESVGMQAGALPAGVLQSTQPVLLRGLVRHWPLVQAAERSDEDFCDYLRGFGTETRLALWRGAPEIGGRFFYNEDFSGFNFQREVHTFGALLDELLAVPRDTFYLGSTEIDSAFPGLGRENALPELTGFAPLVSFWLGNRMQVATHFDLPDNIACVVAGRRRFTLFPPDQVANLYIGPLDLTPAGQPISLVDHVRPDFARFPRYAQALEHAQVFDLLPGDALFIPSQWWHAVEALEPINALVNFWWRQSPPFMDTPLNTLMMALLSLRDLPPAQRDAWRALFDHYIFDADEQTAAHIPAPARSILAPMDDNLARQLRSMLLKRLNR